VEFKLRYFSAGLLSFLILLGLIVPAAMADLHITPIPKARAFAPDALPRQTGASGPVKTRVENTQKRRAERRNYRSR
jgi:hypothetical protein